MCNYELDRDTPVKLEAIPGIGFNFNGWSGGCTGADKICNLVINGDTRVEARFSR